MKENIFQTLNKLEKLKESLFEKIVPITNQNKIVICIIIFLIISGVYIYYFYLPKSAQLIELNNTSAFITQNIAISKNKAANLLKVNIQLEDVQARFNVTSMALPDKKDIPQMLDTISQLGHEAGLKFLLFQPKPEIKETFYAKISVFIKLRGTYHQTVLFLDRISKLSRIINIQNIKLAPVSGYSTEHNAQMLDISCLAMTYYFTGEKGINEKATDQKILNKTNIEKTSKDKANPDKANSDKTYSNKTDSDKTDSDKTDSDKINPAKTDPDKTDPFLPLFMEKPEFIKPIKIIQKRREPQSPLEMFDLSQLKLTAIIKAKSCNRGLMEDVNGKGYIIKKGMYIGKHSGKILKIFLDKIIIEEEIKDKSGNYIIQEKEIKLQKAE